MITLNGKKIVDPVTLLKGYLSFSGTDKIPSDIRIVATDIESGQVVQEIRPNTKTGKYIIILSPGANGKTYSISFEAEGYLPIVETIKIQHGTAYQEIEKGIDLRPINFEGINNPAVPTPASSPAKDVAVVEKTEKAPASKPIPEPKKSSVVSDEVKIVKQDSSVKAEPLDISELNNKIYFDFAKSGLNQEGVVKCKKICEILKGQPKLKISLYGHTDSKGNANYNLQLSKTRARTVANYLAKNGINKNRFQLTFNGESKPCAANQNPDGTDNPTGMQLNRRVEIKIIDKK